jgi:hypothetical protein
MSEVAAALSGLSLEERNPGLTSGEDTPRTSQSVDGEASAVDEVDDVDEDLYGDELLDDDILHEDPIIHIAHAQAAAGTTAAFRARPAPPSTFMEGMGPRLTKAAALRQGLEWEDPRDERRALGEEVPVDFEEVPGHKRALNLVSGVK